MLQTKRLFIRELEHKDIHPVHQLLSLPETDEFNTLGIPETIQVTEKLLSDWINEQNQLPRKGYIFAIDLKETEKFIGLISIHLGKINFKSAEVWFKLHKDFWRMGYTTEALIKLLDFGFNQLKLHRIEAGCAVENLASAKVLEKAGFTREGTKLKNLPIRGDWKDNYFYGILEEDFRN